MLDISVSTSRSNLLEKEKLRSILEKGKEQIDKIELKMDDFFKQFRENLENRPEPVAEERETGRDMDRRLDQLATKAGSPAWWWALPFLVLLLVVRFRFARAKKGDAENTGRSPCCAIPFIKRMWFT